MYLCLNVKIKHFCMRTSKVKYSPRLLHHNTISNKIINILKMRTFSLVNEYFPI